MRTSDQNEGRTHMEIIRLDANSVEEVSHLFDAYRQFYGRKSDLKSAQQFLSQRIANNESIVFTAVKDGKEVVGFVQLYPLFSSLSVGRVWVLNDLYVKEQYRREGIAKKLVEKVHAFAAKDGAHAIVLETASDNTQAQSLYKKFGYEKDTMLHLYFNLDEK